MFPNNGVPINNSRKGKEVANNTAATPPPGISLFPLHHHQRPPQFLSTALRPLQPPLPMASQQPPLQRLCMPFPSFTSLLNDDRSAEIVEQTVQMEEIIKTHSEQLQRTLSDKWQANYNTLICAAEERASKILKEKEQELRETIAKNAELQQMAAHFGAEAQSWQAKARNLELRASTLTTELHKARTTTGCRGVAEDAESSYVDPDRVEPVNLVCKACKKRAANVMMWPCRHLCVCTECNTVSQACPVCLSIKTTSVEVFLS